MSEGVSSLTMQIALNYFDKPFDGNPETLAEVIKTGVDTALGEVLEVLEGLQTFQMNLGSEETERHWCQPQGGWLRCSLSTSPRPVGENWR